MTTLFLYQEAAAVRITAENSVTLIPLAFLESIQDSGNPDAFRVVLVSGHDVIVPMDAKDRLETVWLTYLAGNLETIPEGPIE